MLAKVLEAAAVLVGATVVAVMIAVSVRGFLDTAAALLDYLTKDRYDN